MEKVERMIFEPMKESSIQMNRMEWSNAIGKLNKRLADLFIGKGILLFLIGFLLGRAFILSTLSPFGLPFFASVYLIRRDRAPLVLIGLVGGSLTVSVIDSIYVFGGSLFFLLLYRTTQSLRKDHLKSLPFYIFVTILLFRMGLIFMSKGQISLYDLMMTGVEASLGFVLTLIFIQSIPFFTISRNRQHLKTEEIVCLIILLASVMTGTIGWTIYGLSIENIFSRYLILIFSFVAGATVGSTVGVVTGLIFGLANVTSFSQMSLLAFAGLLGGLLKEGKKLGVSVGLFIATLLISMYGEGISTLQLSIYETLVAIILLYLTPKGFTSGLAKSIPGTAEYSAEQQQYMRKIRDVTAHRVAQFSSMFHALSKSFSQYDINDDNDDDRELDYFLSNVTEKTCQTCFKKEICWAKNFTKTYDLMKHTMFELEENNGNLSQWTNREWVKHCVRNDKVIDAIQKELNYYLANKKLKKQVKESRRLVADQLLGVSEVMSNFAKEIQRERDNHEKQEEQILNALQSFGIEINHVEIYSLEQGNVDIDMTIPYCQGHGQCEKLIAPLLSDILGENIVVKSEECAQVPNEYCYVTFRSAKAFTVETGVAHAAKGGGLISGDSYSMIELGAGKYAIAISDGMGNGEKAHYESNETLMLLKKILQSGIEEKVAIKSVNSILTLRTTDEIFSTLDLAIIDLKDAHSKFLKIGSSPSFVKRGDRVFKIEASNLPIGIVQDFEVDVVSEQLKAGDLLIMMSDGVFEGPKHIENPDLWMKRKIREIETNDPQEVADLLLEEVIRTKSKYIDDDMTVIVAKINHNIPKWSAIPAPIKKRA